MKKLLMILVAMGIMTSPALARFDDPIVIDKVRSDAVFVCKTLAFAIREVSDEIKAVKNKLTPTQYWALLKPMLERGECTPTTLQYRPVEVLCKWTGASYRNNETPLDIKTMLLFKIEVAVPAAVRGPTIYKTLYMITDKEGPDPVSDACASIK